jgi:hypothetical protein
MKLRQLDKVSPYTLVSASLSLHTRIRFIITQRLGRTNGCLGWLSLTCAQPLSCAVNNETVPCDDGE